MMETCAYFLFDENHPTYGELCGRPATREFMVFGSPFPVCSEHFEDAARRFSTHRKPRRVDTTFAN